MTWVIIILFVFFASLIGYMIYDYTHAVYRIVEYDRNYVLIKRYLHGEWRYLYQFDKRSYTWMKSVDSATTFINMDLAKTALREAREINYPIIHKIK